MQNKNASGFLVTLEDYKKSSEGLSTWTEFNASKENYVFSIKLGKPTETLCEKVLVGAV